MDFLEKNLEQIIYENAITNEGRKKLWERGLPMSGKVFRQVPLGSYGRLDLLTVSVEKSASVWKPWVHITIYELKQGCIGPDALMQAGRYAKAIERYLTHKRYNLLDRQIVYSLRLIGSHIEMSDFCLLCDSLVNVELYTYTYDIDGISFTKKEGFCQSDEKLPSYDLSFSDVKEFYGIMQNKND